MQLNYDFDILNPEAGGAFPVVRFRDPRTWEALAHAPKALQALFLDAGFEPGAHHSGAPDGCYPVEHHKCRQRALRSFHTVKSSHYAPQQGQAFDLRAFLAQAFAAEPVDTNKTDCAELADARLFTWQDAAIILAVFLVAQFVIALFA